MINVTKADLPELQNYVKYLSKIWSSHWLTNDGEFVQLLRDELKAYLKIDDLVLVSNGTLAIQLVLKALNLKGEVITTPFTFAATTNALLWEGLTPVFADIHPETFNLDAATVEQKITSKTQAILAVHVYGNPCYVEELQEIANKHKIKLLYDAAHAFGVEYKGESVLNFGDMSTLSFHATKVFNTIEGGAIVAKDIGLYEKLKLLRNHGIKSETEVVLPGTNAKMNEFQAAMGLCNLKELDERISSRRKYYEYYKESLSTNTGLRFQSITASRYNYSYMPVCFGTIQERDEIYSALIKEGIKTRKYFYPLTVNSDFFNGQNLVRKYKLKSADYVANRILCLPLYPDIGMSTVEHIVSLIKKQLSIQ